MIMEEANKSKPQDCGLRSLREVFEKGPTRNIIDFESGRKALEKNGFDNEQNRARLMERVAYLPGYREIGLSFC